MPSMLITEASWADPDGEALRQEQRRELIALYGGDAEPGPKPTGDDVAVFLIGRDDGTGTALACGGLRVLGPGAAEIKRMFVIPAARGRGLARVLLTALESCAMRRGWHLVRLETGLRQVEAVGLYTSSGYRRIDNFGPYVGATESVCFEKRIRGRSRPER